MFCLRVTGVCLCVGVCGGDVVAVLPVSGRHGRHLGHRHRVVGAVGRRLRGRGGLWRRAAG